MQLPAAQSGDYAPIAIKELDEDPHASTPLQQHELHVEQTTQQQTARGCGELLWSWRVLLLLSCCSLAAFSAGLAVGGVWQPSRLEADAAHTLSSDPAATPVTPSAADSTSAPAALPPALPSPPTAFRYLLDELAELQPYAAYSLKRLSRRASVAVRAVRLTDGAELDIGFDPLSSSELHVAGLLAFGGSDMARECGVRLVKWYDQSGNNRHMALGDKPEAAPCFDIADSMAALRWTKQTGRAVIGSGSAAGQSNESYFASVVAQPALPLFFAVSAAHAIPQWKWTARVVNVVQGIGVAVGACHGRWFEAVLFELAPSAALLRRMSEWQRDAYRLRHDDEHNVLRIPSYTLQSAQFPRDWGGHYFAALSNSSSRSVRIGVSGQLVVHVAVVGREASVASGRHEARAAVLVARLQQLAGEQLPTAYSNGWDFHYGDGITAIDSCYYEASAVDAWFRSYVRGSLLSIYHYDGNEQFGSFSVEVDGVVLAIIDANRKLAAPRQTRTQFNVTAAPHSVVLRLVKPGTVRFFGVEGANPVGVVVDDLSLPGMPLRFLSSSTEQPNPTSSADGGWFQLADVMVIVLGVNGAGVVSQQQFIADMAVVVSLYRAAGLHDILIVLVNPGSYDSANFQAYRTALRSFCAERQVALVDLNDVLGADYRTLAEAGFFQHTPRSRQVECTHPGVPSASLDDANGVHPSDVGHYNMATAISQWLLTPAHATSPIVTLT